MITLCALWLNWNSIGFFLRFERLGTNDKGYHEFRHRQTGIAFILAPGGSFTMGTSEAEGTQLIDAYASMLKQKGFSPPLEKLLTFERPQHTVSVKPFLLAKYEVTQSQWQSVMGSNSSEFHGLELPVQKVSWEDCREFCKRTGFSLPTEAQWEYACRAMNEASTKAIEDIAWCESNSNREPHPVGQKASNGFGLHDMLGNVFEWCDDVFDPGFYAKPEATFEDPVSTSGSMFRIYRGGSCNYGPWSCRPGSRQGAEPTSRGGYLGFRPAAAQP